MAALLPRLGAPLPPPELRNLLAHGARREDVACAKRSRCERRMQTRVARKWSVHPRNHKTRPACDGNVPALAALCGSVWQAWGTNQQDFPSAGNQAAKIVVSSREASGETLT